MKLRNKGYALVLLIVIQGMNAKSFMKQAEKSEAVLTNSSSSGRVFIKDIDHHKGALGDKISLRFTREPLCNYLPTAQQDIEGALQSGSEVVLQFLFPLTDVKGEKTKQFITQVNATKHPHHSMRIEPIITPMAGYLVTVFFFPKEIGFQLESFISPKGEPGISFTFHNHGSLKKINYAINTIRRSADLATENKIKKKYA